MRKGPLQLVSRESKIALLIRAGPTRPSATLDLEGQNLVGNGIIAEKGDAALHDRLVFFGRALVAIVRRELGEIWTHVDDCESPVAREYVQALWVRSENINLAAILAYVGIRNELPRADEILSCLSDGCCRQGNSENFTAIAAQAIQRFMISSVLIRGRKVPRMQRTPTMHVRDDARPKNANLVNMRPPVLPPIARNENSARSRLMGSFSGKSSGLPFNIIQRSRAIHQPRHQDRAAPHFRD